MTPSEPTRRNVLLGMCALTAAGITGLFEVGPAAAASAIKVRADGKVDVKTAAFSKNGAVVRLPSLNAALVRVSATKFVAYSLRCTHQGFTVVPSGSSWVCPAHGSAFNPKTGKAVRGPATTGLASLPVKVKAGVATVG